MVGHVEAVEARRRVVRHRVGRAVAVEHAPVALHVGDLPQARHHAADFEPGREQGPVGVGLARQRAGAFALTALTSSTGICPTVVISPFWIRQSRNGPVMSPYGSKVTGPIT